METKVKSIRSYKDVPLEINSEKTTWAIDICFFLVTKLMKKKKIVNK
jgi:hypothetical protein